MKYAVCVKPSDRKNVCSAGLVWVRDAQHELYVRKCERGIFDSREDAKFAITEAHEMIVEVGDWK